MLAVPACHRSRPKPAAEAQSAPQQTAPPVAEEDRPLPVTGIAAGTPKDPARLLRGFYEGPGGWRWTGQSFAVRLDPPEPAQRTRLELDFTAPEELMREVKTVTVTGKVNGVEVAKEQITGEGRHYYSHEIPAKALEKKPAEIEFSIDKIAQGEKHPMGLIVVGVQMVPVEEQVLDHDMQVRTVHAGYMDLLEKRKQLMSVEKQHELMKLFHQIPIWGNLYFQNVQILKNPLDLWIMQQILYEMRPDFIIETGTYQGGSALYWAHTLNGLGLENSRIITMDPQNLTKTAATHALWKKYVTYYPAMSTDPKMLAEIRERVKGHTVLVTLDSDHSMKNVLDELHLYGPMVTRRSYLVVEDTHIDGVPTDPQAGPGPMAAVQKFLTEPAGKDFQADLRREAFIMTFNPGGWLRRK